VHLESANERIFGIGRTVRGEIEQVRAAGIATYGAHICLSVPLSRIEPLSRARLSRLELQIDKAFGRIGKEQFGDGHGTCTEG
jgi:hypothetical protein